MYNRSVLNIITFVHAIMSRIWMFACRTRFSEFYIYEASYTFATHSQDDYIADRGIILHQTALLYIYPRSKEANSKGDTFMRSQSVHLQIRFTRHEPPSPSGENRVGSFSLSCTYFT